MFGSDMAPEKMILWILRDIPGYSGTRIREKDYRTVPVPEMIIPYRIPSRNIFKIAYRPVPVPELLVSGIPSRSRNSGIPVPVIPSRPIAGLWWSDGIIPMPEKHSSPSMILVFF